jgi:hypothetical protein
MGLVMGAYAQEADRSDAYMRLISSVPISNEDIKLWFSKLGSSCGLDLAEDQDFIRLLQLLYPNYNPRSNSVSLKLHSDQWCQVFQKFSSKMLAGDYKDMEAYASVPFAAVVLMRRLDPFSGITVSDAETETAIYFLTTSSFLGQILFARNYATNFSQLMPPKDRLYALSVKYAAIQFWPFVLAFALAIRITRITADVTEWPK